MTAIAPPATTGNAVTITASAAERINHIMRSRPANSMLRVEVVGGGCSGFSYRFDFADGQIPGDTIIESNGARIVVDEISMPYLAGCALDFADELIGSTFRINNPNAKTACGCGISFSL